MFSTVYLARNGGCEEAQEVSEQRTVEVGDSVPIAGKRNAGVGHFVCLPKKNRVIQVSFETIEIKIYLELKTIPSFIYILKRLKWKNCGKLNCTER